jgi:hypothetical protein
MYIYTFDSRFFRHQACYSLLPQPGQATSRIRQNISECWSAGRIVTEGELDCGCTGLAQPIVVRSARLPSSPYTRNVLYKCSSGGASKISQASSFLCGRGPAINLISGFRYSIKLILAGSGHGNERKTCFHYFPYFFFRGF